MYRRLGSLEHEKRVKAIAARLFDLTRSLHRLPESDRRVLCLAAIVHDVGRSVDDETHPQAGARLLREARELRLTPSRPKRFGTAHAISSRDSLCGFDRHAPLAPVVHAAWPASGGGRVGQPGD